MFMNPAWALGREVLSLERQKTKVVQQQQLAQQQQLLAQQQQRIAVARASMQGAGRWQQQAEGAGGRSKLRQSLR